MKLTKNWTFVVVAILSIAVVSVAFYETVQLKFGADAVESPGTLFQLQAFNLFAAGNYEGNTTFAEIARHGDFGIGTVNGLNGEMIALNGEFFQIPTEGSPRRIGESEKTPYATVTFFEADWTLQVDSLNYSQLTECINATLPNYDAIYAIKIHGFFTFAKTRSVPMQTKPYSPLLEAIKKQTVFTRDGAYATSVGFYFPASMDGVDATGYHLHLITDDRTLSGHLLECVVENATVEIGRINNYHLLIP